MIKKTLTSIGQMLADRNMITDLQLDDALSAQQHEGAKLGEVLLGKGEVKMLPFYQTLAEQLDLPFANLIEEPCDEILFTRDKQQIYLTFMAVPWKKEDGVITLATINPTEQLKEWAEQTYGEVSFAITSPYDIYWAIQEHCRKEDDQAARDALWEDAPEQSAKTLLPTVDMGSLVTLGLVLLVMFLAPATSLFTALVALNIFYAATIVAKALFFFTGLIVENKRVDSALPEMKESDMPSYTLLIPLYKEKELTLKGLIKAIDVLDYPKSKLDVKLIVEEDDEETKAIIKQLSPPAYMVIVEVPYSLPRTKPKACNYALRYARGDYVAIYDAEDHPDPQQLIKALQAFQEHGSKVFCVQSRLNYFNREENLLTRLFSIEYSSWFNFLLPGLVFFRIPLPLGGTSNHFRRSDLQVLGAWDPYNVTEDADLGIRIAARGRESRLLNSTTLEEAPVRLRNWFAQRTRWIKGYMQTVLVHMRQPLNLYQSISARGFFGFLFFVAAPVLSMLTLPWAVLMSLIVFTSDTIVMPHWFWQLAFYNLLVGVLLHVVISWLVLKEEGWLHMGWIILIFPFYWLLHTVASYRALYELFKRPHYWDKTSHGESKWLAEEVL